MNFSEEELRSHSSKIGKEINSKEERVLETIPVCTPNEDLGTTPEESEILDALGGMRGGAPGPDKITCSMLRKGGPEFNKRLVKVVQEMWVKDPTGWDEVVHQADVIALFKKGDRSKLDNYRGICLLQVVSKLIARIAAKRITKHLEESGFLAEEQWGFRPYRSSVDAVFVMSRLMADANVMVQEDPLVFDFMDIKKAYPNCSRNAMDKCLRGAGLPNNLVNLVMKLDSETRYRCRGKLGVSEEYRTARGTREGCPAAPVKFNILHHWATENVKKLWVEAGIWDEVVVESTEMSQIWPEGKWDTKAKMSKMSWGTTSTRKGINNIGFADDTTLVGRASTIDRTRGLALRGFEEMGHKVHPDKWQRVGFGSQDIMEQAKCMGGYDREIEMEDNAKALGCYLERDGGYAKELQGRLAGAGAIWGKLCKKLALVKLGDNTKGRLFKASVISSMLYGTEARGIPNEAVKKMQVFVNKCERRLHFGPTEALRKMKGNCTQADIRMKLGTVSVRLEVDNRMARYLGHIIRLPEDRWERRLLLGRVKVEEEAGVRCGRDTWWEDMKRITGEIQQLVQGGKKWYEIAADPQEWLTLRVKWLEGRKAKEREDTQVNREKYWEEVAVRYADQVVRQEVWKKVKTPSAAGTALEGQGEEWLKAVILAGGVHKNGWVEGVPEDWKNRCRDESTEIWLNREGAKVRRRLASKKRGELRMEIASRPISSDLPARGSRRLREKTTVRDGLIVQVDTDVGEEPPRKRLRGKQPAPLDRQQRQQQQQQRNVQDELGKVKCNKCDIWVKEISLSQHNRLYCPFREVATLGQSTRGNRKVLRAVPPSVAKAPPPTQHNPENLNVLGPMPIIHVRWHKPLPQAKRAPTSLPLPTGAGSQVHKARATPRPSLAPNSTRSDIMTIGCYGGCSNCNQCKNCRAHRCNGKCCLCRKCKRCRVWGEQIAEGHVETITVHNEQCLGPPVEIKQVEKKPRLEPARPKVMPKGTSPATHTMCPYCSEWLPYYHRENCPSMPYDLWVTATRQRAIAKHGEGEVAQWRVQCQHCGTPFISPASKRVHLSGCERRRREADLPLNMYPAIREPASSSSLSRGRLT